MGKSFRFVGIASGCVFLWSEFAVAQETSPPETPSATPSSPDYAAPVEAPEAAAGDGNATSETPAAKPGVDPSTEDAAGSEPAGSDTSVQAKKSVRVVPSEVTYDGDVENRDEPADGKSKLPELDLGTRIMAGFRYRQDEGNVDSR